jgi:Beta-propeller repeat
MNNSRWFLSTCLGTAAVCCVLYPVWSSRNRASASDSNSHAGDLKKVSLRTEPSSTADNRKATFQAFAQRPLSFERNIGQSARNIQFVSRGLDYSLALSSEGAVLSLSSGDKQKGLVGQDGPMVKSTAIRMSLVGANQNAAITGVDPLQYKVNYLMGNDPKHWILHVPHYARVKYQGVYPGIDLVYYGNQRQLEYDFVVAPGTDPSQIRLSFDEAKSLRLDYASGDLVITMANGAELHHRRPVIYQMADSTKINIDGSYRILDQKQAAFTVASYDAGKPLVIDPTLDFTTTFGGSLENGAVGIAVDNAGNAYVAGYTLSTDFPQVGTLLGPQECTMSERPLDASAIRPKAAIIHPQTVRSRISLNATAASNSCRTPFVTKISPQGQILFSSYIGAVGGPNTTSANAIAADSTGVFITGSTGPGFVTNAKYAFGAGLSSAYVADLDPSGDSFHWVVGLGGGAASTTFLLNAGTGIALDAQHNAYIVGYTNAGDFPTTEYFEGQHKSWQPVYGANTCSQSPFGFCQNGFVAKVPATGSFDDGGYSTYIGGSVFDTAQAVAVDSTGHAYVTGNTFSPDFPAATSNAGLPPEGSGGSTAFVTKLLPDGSGVAYSYFLGGHEDLANGDGPPADSGNGIAVDGLGQAYVAGSTCSPNFPTTPGAAQTVQAVYCSTANLDTIVNDSGFVSVFSPLGRLMYSTYFGGPAAPGGPTVNGVPIVFTVAQSIALNPRDEIYVAGYTAALEILGNNNPFQSAYENTGFVAKLTPNLSQATFVNYIGADVTGVAVQPPCPGIRCTIESLSFGYQIYATGGTFLPGADVTNDNNLQVFVSKWTDDNIVVTPPRLHQ